MVNNEFNKESKHEVTTVNDNSSNGHSVPSALYTIQQQNKK